MKSLHSFLINNKVKNPYEDIQSVTDIHNVKEDSICKIRLFNSEENIIIIRVKQCVKETSSFVTHGYTIDTKWALHYMGGAINLNESFGYTENASDTLEDLTKEDIEIIEQIDKEYNIKWYNEEEWKNIGKLKRTGKILFN